MNWKTQKILHIKIRLVCHVCQYFCAVLPQQNELLKKHLFLHFLYLRSLARNGSFYVINVYIRTLHGSLNIADQGHWNFNFCWQVKFLLWKPISASCFLVLQKIVDFGPFRSHLKIDCCYCQLVQTLYGLFHNPFLQ